MDLSNKTITFLEGTYTEVNKFLNDESINKEPGTLIFAYHSNNDYETTEQTALYLIGENNQVYNIGAWKYNPTYISIEAGQNTSAESYRAIATGENTIAKGLNSSAHGLQTKAENNEQFVIGRYNSIQPRSLFEVGNGSNVARSNAFTVYADGHAEVMTMADTDNSIVTKQYIDNLEVERGNVGQRTGEYGGEIFNTLVNENGEYITSNKALSNYSSAKGNGTIAGALGFKITEVNNNGELIEFTILDITEDEKQLFNLFPSTSSFSVNLYLDTVITNVNARCFEGDDSITSKIAISYTDIEADIVNNLDPSNKDYFIVITERPELGYVQTEFGSNASAEGNSTKAFGLNSHAENYQTQANGKNSHAEGDTSSANGSASHAEGYHTDASGNFGSHAEGYKTLANGNSAHAEGYETEASGNNSHAEGQKTLAQGVQSHAEGYGTQALGPHAHAEGQGTIAQGNFSHAEGGAYYNYGPVANGECSHAEGGDTEANGACAHAEGHSTFANGQQSHSEGAGTYANGQTSHAQGLGTTASGTASFSGGAYSAALADYSTALGQSVEIPETIECNGAMAIGRYNKRNEAFLFAVGNGDYTGLSNAFTVYPDGTATLGPNATNPRFNEDGSVDDTAIVTVGYLNRRITNDGEINLDNYITRSEYQQSFSEFSGMLNELIEKNTNNELLIQELKSELSELRNKFVVSDEAPTNSADGTIWFQPITTN